MKKIVLILIIFLPITIYSQIDSTTIYYKSLDNSDIRTICNLSDIQIQKIFCKDTTLKGNVFNIIIKEFKKGHIVSVENLNITSEEKQIPMEVNGINMIYVIDMVDRTGFSEFTDSLTITFAGILNKNNFKLNINYPGMNFLKELKGKSNYSLRAANSCFENNVRVPLNTEYPILVYTPPFDTGSSVNSYCMLGEEDVSDWYEKFNVKHYYVFYLEIK